MTYYTSGSAPSTPEPPTLLEAVARSLKLQWQKSAGDVSGYILEMDDESKVSPQLWMIRGEGGTRYKRSYRDVLPAWVTKSASWYMNDPLKSAKFGI